MKISDVLSAAVIAMTLAGCDRSSSSAHLEFPDALILQGVTVIDGRGNAPITNQTLVISDGRVEAILDQSEDNSISGGEILALQGHTVIPGLINGHIHLGGNQEASASLQAMLSLGVTGVRDMGGPSAPLRALNEESATGSATYPKIYYSGTLAGPAFRKDPRIAPLIANNNGEDPAGLWFVDEQSNLKDVIALAKADGAHGLKLYTALNRDLLAQIVAEADRQNIKTWVHGVVFPASTSDAVDAAPTQLIHAKGLIAAGATDLPDVFIAGVQTWVPAQDFSLSTVENDIFIEMFTTMAQNNIALEPALIADGDVAISQGRTLAPWQSQMRDWACEITRKAHSMDVVISAGTDFFGQPGLLSLELKRLVDCGLSPIEAIQAATYNNAMMLGMEETLGSIAVGKTADLVVIDGEITNSLDALNKVSLVIKNGEIVSRPAQHPAK